jgi:hypothetical protein
LIKGNPTTGKSTKSKTTRSPGSAATTGGKSVVKFSISGGGKGANANVIGEHVQLSAKAAGGTVTKATWALAGGVPMYKSQKTPDVKATHKASNTQQLTSKGTKFVNTAYVLQQNKTIGFYWGETPGTETITLSATIMLASGKKAATKTQAKLTLAVVQPLIKGVVTAAGTAGMASGSARVKYYSKAKGAPGVTWKGLSASRGGGIVTVVQTITQGSATRASAGGDYKSYYNANGKQAPYPILDLVKTDTTVFYGNGMGVTVGLSSDSPSLVTTFGAVKFTTIKMAKPLVFKDTVMTRPINGIYVPDGTFTWQIGMNATFDAKTMKWSAGAIPGNLPTAAGLTVVLGHAWPGGWHDWSYLYVTPKKS